MPLIVSAIILQRYQRANRNRFGPISFLIAAYVVVFACSLLLDLLGFDRRAYELDIYGVAYLAFGIGCVLLSHFQYRDSDRMSVKVENASIKRVLDYCFLVSNVGAIVFFFPSAMNALTGDVENNRVFLADTTQRLQEAGLLNTYFSTICSSFGISLVLGFANLTQGNVQKPLNKALGFALLVSSTAYIVYIFAWVGRDGFVFWLMLFALVYLLFKPALHFTVDRNAKKLYFLTLLVTLPVFVAITTARFGGKEDSIFLWVLIYLGEQVNNFSDYYQVYSEGYSQGGALNFPLVMGVLGNLQLDRLAMNDLYLSEGVTPWRFATFIGSFLMDVGPYFTLLLIFAYFFVVRINKVTQPARLSALCVWVTIIQIPLFGVFYFRQYSSNFAVVFCLLVALVLRLSRLR